MKARKATWVVLLLMLMTSCTSTDKAEPTPTPPPSPTMTMTPTLVPTPTPLPYETIPGVYLGTFHGTKVSSLELFEELGKGIAISALYMNWGTGFFPGMYSTNARLGRIMLVTWEYKPRMRGAMADYEGRSLQALVDGVHDDYLAKWAGRARDFGKPILVRWGHEMNGDWYPWSGFMNGGGATDGFGDPAVADGPERFVAAYRHIHDLFAEAGADNVLWVWCPNAPFDTMTNSLGDWNDAASYYPGDDYVDWLCFDGYNWGRSAFGQQFNSVWTSFDDIFAPSYRQLQDINPGKPIIIGESASTEVGGDKAAWITDTFECMQADYAQIKAIIWFHISKETDWRINSSPESLQAYRQAISGDYWLEQWPGMDE